MSGGVRALSQGRDGVVVLDTSGLLRVESPASHAPRLARSVEFHRAATGPFLHVVDAGDGWATFGPDVGINLAALLEAVGRGVVPRLPYTCAIAFVSCMFDAVARAEALGCHLGWLGPSHVMLTVDGEVRCLGLGGLEIDTQGVVAPDVALGAPLSVGGDLYALKQLLRTSLTAVDLPAALRRMYAGTPTTEESSFLRRLLRLEEAIGSTDPSRRMVSVQTVRRGYERFWKFLGVRPDHEGLGAYARDAVGRLQNGTPRVVYDRSKKRMDFQDGRVLNLARRPVLGRLLDVLVRMHVEEERRGLQTHELIERVWPGERIMFDAARNRLYVAISKLRKEGLGELLDRDAAGRYGLRPELAIECRQIH